MTDDDVTGGPAREPAPAGRRTRTTPRVPRRAAARVVVFVGCGVVTLRRRARCCSCGPEAATTRRNRPPGPRRVGPLLGTRRVAQPELADRGPMTCATSRHSGLRTAERADSIVVDEKRLDGGDRRVRAWRGGGRPAVRAVDRRRACPPAGWPRCWLIPGHVTCTWTPCRVRGVRRFAGLDIDYESSRSRMAARHGPDQSELGRLLRRAGGALHEDGRTLTVSIRPCTTRRDGGQRVLGVRLHGPSRRWSTRSG